MANDTQVLLYGSEAADVIEDIRVSEDTATRRVKYAGGGEVAAPVAQTAATLAVTAAEHSNRPIVLNRAAGVTATLPAATGSGARYVFVNATTVTSNNHIIQVTGNDVFIGKAIITQDAGDTLVSFECASDSDTITMNGSTKGGLKGDIIEIIDVAADTYHVTANLTGTGTEATPFSAAVS